MKLAYSKSYIKSISSMRCLAAAAFAGMAALPAVATDYYWNPSVYEGFLSDAWYDTSSNPGKPGDGDCERVNNQRITSAGEYVLKVPTDGVYYDAAGTEVGNLPAGTKITFDATGATWVKQKTAGTAWGGGRIFNVQMAHHFFAIDNLNANNANDWFGFTFQDGKMSAEYTDIGATFKLLSGTFNNAFLTDQTTATPHSTSILYTTSPGANVEFAGGTTYLRSVNVIGQSVGGKFLVSGGDHHVYGGLKVRTGGGGEEVLMQISGGQVTLEESCLWLGYNASGRGVLRIDGDGTFLMGATSQHIYFPDGAAYTGLLSIGGHGTYSSPATSHTMMAGHNGGTADILVEEYGTFSHNGLFQLSDHANATVSLTAKDNATVDLPNASIANAAGSKVTVNIEDDAVVKMKTGDVAGNATTDFTLNMSGNAKLLINRTDKNEIYFGNNNAAKVTLDLQGGTMANYDGEEITSVILRGGPESTYIFGGVNIDTKNLSVQGPADESAPEAWYIARQTNGVINVNRYSGGNGLDICGGKGRNAMYLLEGGELYVGNMLRVAYGTADTDNKWHAIYRQTGGFATLWQVNMCDNASLAEFELLGGRTRVYALRGWNQSVARNANGAWATALFDGGTIEPWNNGSTTIYTMPELRLGANGLTFDTLAFDNVSIDAKFQNEGEGTDDEAEGLFVKTGTGTLKANMLENAQLYVNRDLRSYHSVTRVDQGTLLLTKAADVAFGKNIIVKGGATLSLEGNAETLTVDTLTLGDGHGFAVLKLDAGDTVVVEASNGVTANCGAIDVPWKSTEGTYPVFTCKLGVQIGELDKIAVYNADETKDYGWTTEVDNDTGFTICSVTVAPKGTLTKTITYSSGAVTTNGTGKVSGIIAEETGTQSGELVLASAASVSVDAGQTITLNGPLVGTGIELKKTDSGKLVLDGSNPDFYGSLVSAGGTLEVLSAAALGADPVYLPLVLGAGTFLYSDKSNEAVFEGGLRIEGTTQKQSILKNEGDITVKSVEYVSGAFTKTGKGKLTFDLPAGTFSLGTNSQDEFINLSDGPTVLPASGEPPASNAGLGGVNFLEGTVKVKGEGVDKTTLQTRNTAILAGSVAGAAQTVLDLEDVQFKHGDGSHPGQVARGLPAGTPAPAFRLKNAKFWSDSLILGYSSSNPDSEIDIQMENSEFWPHYTGQIGSQTVAIRIDADNSQFHSDGLIGWGIKAKTFNADFYGEDAEMGTYSDGQTYSPEQLNWRAGIVEVDNVSGKVTFRDGARFATSRGVVVRGTSTVDFEFDGGIFEIRKFNQYSASTSTWATVASKTTGFTTTGGGLELSIIDGFSHAIEFPIMGDGKVVKTGEGTFKLVEARAEGEKLLQYTGGTVVSNGTFVIDGSLVADGAKSFEVCAGAVLDLNGSVLTNATIAGAGQVVNGTLVNPTLAYDADALTTFDGVEFDGVLFIDFGRTAEDPLDRTEARAGILVAHYAEGTVPEFTKVKALNTGIPRAKAGVSCVDGDIVITTVQTGFEVRLR